MTTTYPWFCSLLVSVSLAAFSASCGSGSGSSSASEFVTADSQGGISAGWDVSSPTTGLADAGTGVDTLAEEIAEADLYRLDGNRLFLLNSYRGLTVVDLASRQVTGRMAFLGVPHELLVRNDRAFVVITTAAGGGALMDVSIAGPEPLLRARFALSGSPKTSRAIGDRLVVVTNGEESSKVDSFLLNADVVAADNLTLPIHAEQVHASNAFLFVTSSPPAFGSTNVHVVDVSNTTGLLALRGSIEVAGTIMSDDRIDFAAGTFRIVTRTSNGMQVFSRLSMIGVANPDAPVVLGTLDIGHGEQPFAARFGENELYLVTFEQIDPLWVVDLSNPAVPYVAGELIVPGWSSQLVALPNERLLALGVDPSAGWTTTVSLFDVSNASAPALASRIELGTGVCAALTDRKAFGVFPELGLALLPYYDTSTRLAVVDFTSNTLTLRGFIETVDEALRGFPSAVGLCALTTTSVVVANPNPLTDTERIVVADNVLDVARVGTGDDSLRTLTQEGPQARLGDVLLPLYGDRLYPHATSVAVTGYDDIGRAAYVVNHSGPAPVVSPRIDLGAPGAMAFVDGAADTSVGIWSGGGNSTFDSAVTTNGRFVVRGLTPETPDIVIGQGLALDGFVVVDLATGAVESRIQVRGSNTTGIALDGEDLVVTLGRHSGVDHAGRPLLVHYLWRVQLDSLAAAGPVNVPGSVLALAGDLVYTAEQAWSLGWAVDTSVVVSRLREGKAVLVDRLLLPDGAYDLRVAEDTLYYTTGVGYLPILLGSITIPWLPATSISTVRLGTALSQGPTLDLGESFATLLRVEETGVLIVKNGLTVERFDTSGAAAVKQWSRDIGSSPRVARPDEPAGSYLLALGLGGLARVP